MGVLSFTFSPALTESFIRLGYDLYCGDPGFVAPLERGVRAMLAPSFPFYARPGHAHGRFLAVAKGRPVARALASIHPGLRDRDGTPVGAIGFFEAADEGAGAEILAASVEWLAARGRTRVWGPLQFDLWHGYRFLTRGADLPRLLGEPSHARSYPELFERNGFTVKQRWNSFPLAGPASMRELAAPGAGDRARLSRLGYRFRCVAELGRARVLTLLPEILDDAFSGFLGFTPLPASEFASVLGPGLAAMETEVSGFLFDEAGRPAAFGIAFVDAVDGLRSMRGSDSWLARLRFAGHRLRARRLLLHLGGVTRAEAVRHSGAARAMVHELLVRALAGGYHDVVVSMVAHGNPIRRHYAPFDGDQRREYALFERRHGQPDSSVRSAGTP